MPRTNDVGIIYLCPEDYEDLNNSISDYYWVQSYKFDGIIQKICKIFNIDSDGGSFHFDTFSFDSFNARFIDNNYNITVMFDNCKRHNKEIMKKLSDLDIHIHILFFPSMTVRQT